MKALVIKNRYIAFFFLSATNDFMLGWLKHNIEKIGLNEEWSCSVDFHTDEGGNEQFIIQGNEDFEEVDIIEVKPIDDY